MEQPVARRVYVTGWVTSVSSVGTSSLFLFLLPSDPAEVRTVEDDVHEDVADERGVLDEIVDLRYHQSAVIVVWLAMSP